MSTGEKQESALPKNLAVLLVDPKNEKHIIAVLLRNDSISSVYEAIDLSKSLFERSHRDDGGAIIQEPLKRSLSEVLDEVVCTIMHFSWFRSNISALKSFRSPLLLMSSPGDLKCNDAAKIIADKLRGAGGLVFSQGPYYIRKGFSPGPGKREFDDAAVTDIVAYLCSGGSLPSFFCPYPPATADALIAAPCADPEELKNSIFRWLEDLKSLPLESDATKPDSRILERKVAAIINLILNGIFFHGHYCIPRHELGLPPTKDSLTTPQVEELDSLMNAFRTWCGSDEELSAFIEGEAGIKTIIEWWARRLAYHLSKGDLSAYPCKRLTLTELEKIIDLLNEFISGKGAMPTL